LINFTIGMRVDAEVEEEGLDRSEHGGPADDYQSSNMTPRKNMDMMGNAGLPMDMMANPGLVNPAYAVGPMSNIGLPGMSGTMGMGAMGGAIYSSRPGNGF
jgi:hypothetical protein